MSMIDVLEINLTKSVHVATAAPLPHFFTTYQTSRSAALFKCTPSVEFYRMKDDISFILTWTVVAKKKNCQKYIMKFHVTRKIVLLIGKFCGVKTFLLNRFQSIYTGRIKCVVLMFCTEMI
jgi:hypothetical protein